MEQITLTRDELMAYRAACEVMATDKGGMFSTDEVAYRLYGDEAAAFELLWLRETLEKLNGLGLLNVRK